MSSNSAVYSAVFRGSQWDLGHLRSLDRAVTDPSVSRNNMQGERDPDANCSRTFWHLEITLIKITYYSAERISRLHFLNHPDNCSRAGVSFRANVNSDK